MSQVTNFPSGGLRLTKSCLILCGLGDPNSSAQVDVQNAGIGSLFLRQDAPDSSNALYICSTAGIPKTVTENGTPAIWTAK